MAGNGLNMKDINEIKRRHKLGLTERQTSRTLKIHRNTVSKYIDEALLTTPATIEIPPVEASWPQNIDWEKVCTEYLDGVPMNIIHEELFEGKKSSRSISWILETGTKAYCVAGSHYGAYIQAW